MILECKRVDHGSDEYWKAVELRREVLRKPLGLDYTDAQLQAESDSNHFVCLLDDNVVGSALAVSENDAVIRIKQVAVSGSRQGTGIGRCIMQFVENWATEKGYKGALLHSRGYAIPFYEKLGYLGFGDEFEEVGIPHLRMQKSLSTS
jgi:predicted GNAT family N-acyltransferase